MHVSSSFPSAAGIPWGVLSLAVLCASGGGAAHAANLAAGQMAGVGEFPQPSLVLKPATQLQTEDPGSVPTPPADGNWAQTLEQLYLQGRHATLGTQALDLLRGGQFKPDDTLRLKIANSLAWTLRLNEAAEQYEQLISGPEAKPAQLALANTYRWLGRPDLAVPLYENLLEQDLNHADARDGLDYADREVRPRTTVQWRGSNDSGDMQVNTLTLTHRWRDKSMRQIFEVETEANRDRLTPAQLQVNQHQLGLRYENLGLPLQPRVFLSLQNRPERQAFGGVRVRLGQSFTYLTAEHMNWGVASLSARALNAGLTAKHVGLESRVGFPVGELSAQAHAYRISDGNTLLTSSLRFAPLWRPLGPAFKPYVAVDTRDVKFNTPNYWSPETGSGSASLGATAEWAEKDWFFYVAAQAGQRLYGEAGSSWSASIGAQRWLSRDMSVGVHLWGMSSIRDQARYRAHSGTVKLEKLW